MSNIAHELMWGGTPPKPKPKRESTWVDKWVCKDKKNPWYGQGSSTYGYKESMYAIDPNPIGMK